ncbi:receptor-type tyrosine-protein phosphatase C isoform X2 [Sebastes fasciatus]|uniref:receptor-type tyrosine-protein phosphatase C isoform X2 n=1 Tax=Sebastes fasciatus TaxID=394691 RepID=UPI003D9DC48B
MVCGRTHPNSWIWQVSVVSRSCCSGLGSSVWPAVTLHLTATTAPPASTSPSPLPTPSKPIDSQTNTTDNQTPPTITTPITSVTPTTEGSYTVTPITFGFRIDMMMSSTTGNYTITLNEEGQQNKSIHFSSQSHEIEHLKPCTEYEHSVAFIDAGKATPCNPENETMTSGMSKDDIKEGSCMPGYVCYQSDWNISSSLSASNNVPAEPCKTDNKTFCIKPGFDDICTDLTTTFRSDCTASFNVTKSITVAEFLNVSEITQKAPTKLPVKIDTELPPNCTNLTVDYTCQEDGKPSNTKNLTELEPFTDYSCTGQIKENNVTKKNTNAVKFKIDCDITIIYTKQSATDKSIKLSWITISQNCPGLHDLQKFSYDCSCDPPPSHQSPIVPAKKVGSEGKFCDIVGLKPFTYYTCKVQPKYDNKNVHQPTEVKEKTLAGTPDDIHDLTVIVVDHNVIRVKCVYKGSFNGPKVTLRFIARLRNAGVTKELKNTTCDFNFEDLSYLTEYNVEVTAYNGEFESKPKKKDGVTTSYNDKAVIGLLVFLIILTSVALLLVIYKIYILKRRNSNGQGESMSLIQTPNDEENLLPVEPIAAEFLLEAYKRKLADEGRLFLAEFQSIPRIFSRYSVKEAKKPCNVPKNRYVDILPYDHNRVQLTTGNGEAGCDYINASFIDGYKESKKYIAAQGPKDETVSDFWRMVWEQQSSIIVMVTRCEEGNRVKCAQYWPSQDRETEIYEEFIVKLNSEDRCPDYTIRHLSLTNRKEKNSEREVTHIQFMSWPDHGVPGEPHLLLKLRRRVNAFKNFFSGPIVVHCSAGVGRTGTYIGIDAMMECLEAEGRVDIYGYVVRLRRQRCLMVQVEAQYILIHQALLEHNQFGETEITVSELHSTLSALQQETSGNEPTLMEEEFDRLPVFKNWRTFNTGMTEENKKKNRSATVIPYDYNRVLLKIDEGRSRDSDPDEEDEEESSDEEDEESTKYINASHIDGYWGPRAFIAAQTPLPDTVADFWSMVYQKKASTIVMLSDCSEKSDCVYWDKEKKTFGDFEVEVASTDTSPTFISRNMLLRHVKRKESRPVKQFQFLKWANGEPPEKPQELTDMIKDIKNRSGSSKSQRSMTVVVHCNDGSTRTGVFCALWNLLDSAETEKLVDVFQVVKTLRKERQGMLSNLEQYRFLYDALEGVFPVQNGEVKPVQASEASEADTVQVVNETKAAEKPAAEEKAEQPATTTSNNQQEAAAESAPLVADGGKEEKKEDPESETAPLEDITVTLEV